MKYWNPGSAIRLSFIPGVEDYNGQWFIPEFNDTISTLVGTEGVKLNVIRSLDNSGYWDYWGLDHLELTLLNLYSVIWNFLNTISLMIYP